MAVMVVNAVVAKVAKHVAVPAKADAARVAAKPAWPDVAKVARTVAARRDQTIAVKVVQKAAPTFVAKAAAKAGRNLATVNNAGVRAGASAAKAATEAVGTIVARHPPVKPLRCPPAARHRAKPVKPLTPSAASAADATTTGAGAVQQKAPRPCRRASWKTATSRLPVTQALLLSTPAKMLCPSQLRAAKTMAQRAHRVSAAAATAMAATDASAHPVTRRKLVRPAPPRPSR